MPKKKGGFNEKLAEKILKLLNAGMSKVEVAETLGVSRRTIFHYLKRMYNDPRYHEKVKKFYEPATQEKSEPVTKEAKAVGDNKAMLTQTIQELQSETEKLSQALQKQLVEPTVVPTVSQPLNVTLPTQSEGGDPMSILKNLKEQLDKLQQFVKAMGEMQMKVGKSISEISSNEVERAKRLLEDLGYVVIPREKYMQMSEDEAIRLLTRKGYKIVSPYIHIDRDLPKILEEYKKKIEEKYKENETKEILDIVKSVALGIVDALTRGDLLSMLNSPSGGGLGLANLGGLSGSSGGLWGSPSSFEEGNRGSFGDIEKATEGTNLSNDNTTPVSILGEGSVGSGEEKHSVGGDNQGSSPRRWNVRGRPKKSDSDREEDTT